MAPPRQAPLPRQTARLPRCSSRLRRHTSDRSMPHLRACASSPRRPSLPGDRRTLSGTASRSRAMSAPRAAIRRCNRPAGSQTCPWPLQIRSARRRPSRYRRRRKQEKTRICLNAASPRSSRTLRVPAPTTWTSTRRSRERQLKRLSRSRSTSPWLRMPGRRVTCHRPRRAARAAHAALQCERRPPLARSTSRAEGEARRARIAMQKRRGASARRAQTRKSRTIY